MKEVENHVRKTCLSSHYNNKFCLLRVSMRSTSGSVPLTCRNNNSRIHNEWTQSTITLVRAEALMRWALTGRTGGVWQRSLFMLQIQLRVDYLLSSQGGHKWRSHKELHTCVWGQCSEPDWQDFVSHDYMTESKLCYQQY